MATAKSVTCAGQLFPRIEDLAAHYGVHKSTVARRLRDGWSSEEAVGLVPHKNLGHGNAVTYQNVTYRTFQDLCRALGVEPATLRARIARGYSLEDAVAANFKETLHK